MEDTEATRLTIDNAVQFVSSFKKMPNVDVNYVSNYYNNPNIKSLDLIYQLTDEKMVLISIDDKGFLLEQWVDGHNIKNTFCDLEKLVFLCLHFWFEHKFKLAWVEMEEWKVVEQIDGTYWIVCNGKQIAHCHANSPEENKTNAYDIVKFQKAFKS